MFGKLLKTAACAASWAISPSKRQMAYKFYKVGTEINNLRKLDQKKEKGIKFVADKFFEVTENMLEEEKEKLAEKIKSDRKELKDLNIGYDPKKQTASLNLYGVGLDYSPKDGSANFKIGFDF